MDQKVRFWGIRIILRVECGGWQEEKDQEVPLRCIRVLTHDSWSKEVSAFSGTDPVLWSRVVWDLAGGSAWELWLPFLWGKGHISGLFSIQTKLCLSISSSRYVFICWPVDKQEHIEALHMEWPQLDVVMLPARLSYQLRLIELSWWLEVIPNACSYRKLWTQGPWCTLRWPRKVFVLWRTWDCVLDSQEKANASFDTKSLF